MLFGNNPPQRPKGLFGMFAPGQGQIPMPQQQTPPVGQDQTQQLQSLMGANMSEPKKPGFFGEGGIGRMIAGGLGDVLLQNAGMQPLYIPQMQRRQELAQRQQMMQQQREADWQDWQKQFDYKAQYERDNPSPIKNDTVNDYQFIAQNLGPEAAKQFLANLADPMVTVPMGNTVYSGPRSGLGKAMSGGAQSGGNIQSDWDNAKPLTGGGVGNGTGGFPVTGSKLDSVTARNESGNRDYYSNGAAVVSPKGARFAMQVLPSTAQDPGFGLRPANPNDPADMNRLGREYRAKMESRYKGNLPLMWAAYNAGPGRIDNLLAKYGQNWLQYAPRETQDYVARNMRAVRGN